MCADQAEQTKYEARIVGLQRAKHEAVAKAEAQSQKAILLQQEFDKHVAEKARYAQKCVLLHPKDHREAVYACVFCLAM